MQRLNCAPARAARGGRVRVPAARRSPASAPRAASRFMLEDRSGGTRRVPRAEHGASSSPRRTSARVRAGLHHLRPERAAGLRQRGSREGPQAGRRSELGLQDAAGVHGRRLRQLLQPLRTRLAGLRPGRGRVTAPTPSAMGQFYVRNDKGGMVPLDAVVDTKTIYGPEFTIRFNEHRAAQINASLEARATAPAQGMKALEEVFAETMPPRDGLRLHGHVLPGAGGGAGRVAERRSSRFSLLMVFLILAAQYESWTLPFSVLLGIPIAVFGAFLGLFVARDGEQRLRADRPGHADRADGEERDPDRRVLQGRVREGHAAHRGGARRARSFACGRS